MKTLYELMNFSVDGLSHWQAEEMRYHQQRLKDFFSQYGLENAIFDIAFDGICLDSRKICQDDVFILLKSYAKQAADEQAERKAESDKVVRYLKQVEQKAALILSEVDFACVKDDLVGVKTPMVYVPNIRMVLGSLIQSHLQYDDRVDLPRVVAVTGTNGKTTISQLVAQLCQLLGQRSAVMGTAGNGRLDQLVQSSHTTSDALAVQTFLHQMGQQAVEVLSLEASSHGLHQQRLQGVPVQVAIYSNLSRDHMDYHVDMDDYAAAKARLFDKQYFPELSHAIINQDDEYAHVMLAQAKKSGLAIWTYGMKASEADFRVVGVQPSLQGTLIRCLTPFCDEPIELASPLLGQFNVGNLLAALAGVLALYQSVLIRSFKENRVAELSCFNASAKNLLAIMAQKMSDIEGADGRMQRVASKEGCFLVDYAHTPDALSQVLSSLKPYCQGQLWVVFGCGGDRDKGKRPMMAQAGLAGADKVVFTSDNPRSENPNAILADMQVGMTCEQHYQVHIEPDRKKAIFYAVQRAGQQDVVVIAGKGHESYQEINGIRHDFDDRVVLVEALRAFGK